MATQTLNIKRSDRFPVGTAVKVFAGINKHHEGKPSSYGTALAEGTVGADGKLTISGLPEGMLTLWAEVGGVSQYITTNAAPYAPPLPTLRERVLSRRVEAGVF